MPVNMNEFREGKREGTLITAKCRLIYPALFEPTDMKGNTNGPEDKLRYRAGLLVPKSANTELLLKAVNKVIGEQKESDRKIARKPFLKVEEQNSLSKYADEYPLLLRCTSKFEPQVVGPNPSRKLTEDEVYSGRWAVCSINPYWYGSIDGGKPGVSLGLNNVQFLDHDEIIGGSRVAAEDEFEAVDVDEGDAPSGDGDGSASNMFD